VPDFGATDVKMVMKNPSVEEVVGWIARGERAVWPQLCAVMVRCAVEKALESGLESVRRRGGATTSGGNGVGGGNAEGGGGRVRGVGSRGGVFDWGQD
jgi:TAG lipase/lysophosphatidylethanolamine acyltransferase